MGRSYSRTLLKDVGSVPGVSLKAIKVKYYTGSPRYSRFRFCYWWFPGPEGKNAKNKGKSTVLS
jgi:hypothetical protein